MTLSVAIVAMDEEANIGRTLASVRWADEIVLVDSGSKDRTCRYCGRARSRWLRRPWRGYVAQKQYAIELCTKDWVLLLDADEEVSPGLAEEIRAAVNETRHAISGYWLPRAEPLGRWIRAVLSTPSCTVPPRAGFVTGHDPHDRCRLKPGRSSNAAIQRRAHSLLPGISTLYLVRMNRYSSLGRNWPAGQIALVMILLLRPMATFVYNYFIRLGFLDGREEAAAATSPRGLCFLKYAKAWELCLQRF